MTVEFVYLEASDLLRLSDDQRVLVVPTTHPSGWENNPQTVLLNSGESSDAGDGDSTAPTVTLVSPTTGLLGRDTELVLDITDAGGIRRASVWHTSQGGKTEVVYDGEVFRVGFTGTVESITDGFRLRVTRIGGWFPPLKFEASVHDTSGNEATS